MNIVGLLRSDYSSTAETLVRLSTAVPLWSLVIWKIWTRPRQWGRGVGIVMLLVVPCQVFLWYRAMRYFERLHAGMNFGTELLRFLPYEILLTLAGVLCLILGSPRKQSS